MYWSELCISVVDHKKSNRSPLHIYAFTFSLIIVTLCLTLALIGLIEF